MFPRSLVSRRLAPLLVDALTEARVVAVLGPRRAGESTIVRTLDPTAAGDRFVAGVVLYTGADTVGFGDDLSAAPLCGLWHDADSVWESDGRET